MADEDEKRLSRRRPSR